MAAEVASGLRDGAADDLVLPESPGFSGKAATASVPFRPGLILAASHSSTRSAPSRDGADLVLECDAAKIKPGLKGTLAVAAFPEKPGDSGKTKSSAAPSRNPLATSAAIPFEIVSQ